MTWITEEEARMMDEEMHSRYVRWQRANEEARFREVVHPYKSTGIWDCRLILDMLLFGAALVGLIVYMNSCHPVW